MRASVGKSEIKFSLHTRDPVLARIRNLEEMVRLERAWSGIDGTVVDALHQPATHFECKSTIESAAVATREAASERDEPPPTAPSAEAGLPKAAMWLRSVFDSYAGEAELAPSTVKRWSPVVDRLIAHLGHDDAAAIARADIVAWKDALLDGGMSNVTVRDVYVAAVNSMRQFAVDQGQLTQSPAKEVKVRVRKALEERDKAFDGREAGTIPWATLRKPSDRPASRWRQRGDGCLDLRLSTSSKAYQDGIQGFSWA